MNNGAVQEIMKIATAAKHAAEAAEQRAARAEDKIFHLEGELFHTQHLLFVASHTTQRHADIGQVCMGSSHLAVYDVYLLSGASFCAKPSQL